MTARRTPLILVAGVLLLLAIGSSVLAAPFGSRSLYTGRFGADVAELQRKLNSLGYSSGTADGLFGPRTRAAVTAFERESGLVADGLVDQWTFQAITRAEVLQNGTTHTVGEGETLSSIAERTGTTGETLVWLNQLSSGSLRVGQEIRLPAPDAVVEVPPTTVPPSPAEVPPAPPATPSDPSAPESDAPPAGGDTDPASDSDPANPPGDGTSSPDGPEPTAPSGDDPTGSDPTTTDPTGEDPTNSDPATSEPQAPPAGSIGGDLQTPQPGHAQWLLPGLIPLDYLVTLPPPAPAEDPSTAPSDRPLVVGYYAEDWQGDLRALESLAEAGPNVDMVVNFQLQLDANGNLSTREYPELMAAARERGMRVYGLVHNFQGSGFSAEVARSVLANPAVRANAVEQMSRAARLLGLSGIDIDIENVPPDLRPYYTALIKELSERLKPEGVGLTISIPAKTFDDRRSGWSGAFDYAALGQYADRVAIMAYDEHTPGYTAGPVASLGWAEQVAKFASSQIEPKKVLLGIATYGYDWVQGTTRARGLSIPGVKALAQRTGATVQWDQTAQVPWFTYTESGVDRVVYYEDERSLAPKLDLVAKYGLGGIAIWRLGLEDPAIWPVIQAKLR